jgi:hypothetical protein
LRVVVEKRHPIAARACRDGTHVTCGPGTKYDNIMGRHGGWLACQRAILQMKA